MIKDTIIIYLHSSTIRQSFSNEMDSSYSKCINNSIKTKNFHQRAEESAPFNMT